MRRPGRTSLPLRAELGRSRPGGGAGARALPSGALRTGRRRSAGHRARADAHPDGGGVRHLARAPRRRCRHAVVRDRRPGRRPGDLAALPADGAGPTGHARQAPPPRAGRGGGPGPGRRAVAGAPRRRRGAAARRRHRLGATPVRPAGRAAGRGERRAAVGGAAAAALRRLRGDRPRRARSGRRSAALRRDRPHPALLRRAALPGHHPCRPGPAAGGHGARRRRLRTVDRLPVGGRLASAGPAGPDGGPPTARGLPRAHRPTRRPRGRGRSGPGGPGPARSPDRRTPDRPVGAPARGRRHRLLVRGPGPRRPVRPVRHRRGGGGAPLRRRGVPRRGVGDLRRRDAGGVHPRSRSPRAARRSRRPGGHGPAEPGPAREGVPHGLARRLDRAAQPPPLRGPGRAGAGPVTAGR